MKKKDALARIRFAGYHDDTATKIRIYAAQSISLSVANAAFAAGRRMKKEGIACGCRECNQAPEWVREPR